MHSTTSYDERVAQAAALVELAKHQQQLANAATERAMAAVALLTRPDDADREGR